jgi:hypothetical protein
MKQPKNPRFSIGDPVYHVIPESPQGVVIDIIYSYLTGMHEYSVAFDHNIASLKYFEHELSSTKTYPRQ